MKDLITQSSVTYLDLEWDCDNRSSQVGAAPEIIEVGLVQMDTSLLTVVHEANFLVRPRQVDVGLVCGALTGITREDLLRAMSFREVISQIASNWPAKATCFAWGNDGEILSRACNDHRVAVPFRRFVDLSQQIQHTLMLAQPVSVRRAVEALGLFFDGAAHVAVADARNACRIHAEVLRRIRSCQPLPSVHQGGVATKGRPTWFGQTLQASLDALKESTGNETIPSTTQPG